MDVGIMRMAVSQDRVGVRMRVRLPAVPVEVMVVLVVLVMDMTVRMRQERMRMHMLMPLLQVQPHTRSHQGRGRPEKRRGVLAQARTAIAAPMNGAVEKYAPVRAAPSPRSATTKNTRLTP